MLSLPSRERELKPDATQKFNVEPSSLPSRERELKQAVEVDGDVVAVSLPSRERELKPLLRPQLPYRRRVAPLAGARIETAHRPAR